jgi:hypothetical protein
VGYATIDIRGRVPTFQTTVYPCLPTWPFSKVYGVPIRRSYFGTCAQAICERRPITCSNIATETGFDPPLGEPPGRRRIDQAGKAPLLEMREEGRLLGIYACIAQTAATSARFVTPNFRMISRT